MIVETAWELTRERVISGGSAVVNMVGLGALSRLAKSIDTSDVIEIILTPILVQLMVRNAVVWGVG